MDSQEYNNLLSVVDLTSQGDALAESGKYQEAIRLYDQALKVNPQMMNPKMQKGIALSKIGKNKEAMELFNQILNENPVEHRDAEFMEIVYEVKSKL